MGGLPKVVHIKLLWALFAVPYSSSERTGRSPSSVVCCLSALYIYMSAVKRKGTFVTSSHYVRTAGCLTSSRSRYRAKNLVAPLGTFQSSITRNSLIHGRIEVKLVSMGSERSILHVYNQIFVLLCIWEILKTVNLLRRLIFARSVTFQIDDVTSTHLLRIT